MIKELEHETIQEIKEYIKDNNIEELNRVIGAIENFYEVVFQDETTLVVMDGENTTFTITKEIYDELN